MAWVTNAAVQVQNLITGTQVIGTNLTNNGWTLYDNVANAPVYSATNNQGATQYVQITQGGTYQYIQLQGWQSWNAGTHAGTNGSGTTVHRIYFAGAVQGATTTVDLYMAVTANRFIIYINGVGNYRHWGYFGGLGTLAGTSDSTCVHLCTCYEPNANAPGWQGVMLQTLATGALWASNSVDYATMAYVANGGSPAGASATVMRAQGVPSNGNQIVIAPVLVVDISMTHVIRGDLDGMFFCPVGAGAVGHLDTTTIGGTTYLIVIPQGNVDGGDRIPLQGGTATLFSGMAIAEA